MYKKLSPHKVTVENEGTVYICQCGKTGDIPFCNGSHAGTDKTPLTKQKQVRICLFVAAESLKTCHFVMVATKACSKFGFVAQLDRAAAS